MVGRRSGATCSVAKWRVASGEQNIVWRLTRWASPDSSPGGPQASAAAFVSSPPPTPSSAPGCCCKRAPFAAIFELTADLDAGAMRAASPAHDGPDLERLVPLLSDVLPVQIPDNKPPR
jgi:hypothetical protein